MSLRLVMLDRDGTLNRKAPPGEYITSADQVRLLPGAVDAVRELVEQGLLVVVVTNQRCVGLGVASIGDVSAVNAEIDRRLRARGGRVDRWYVCPHREGECDCRKPLPGLLIRAMLEHGVDAREAVAVGDMPSDVEAARRAGVRSVRIANDPDPTAWATALSLRQAAVQLARGATEWPRVRGGDLRRGLTPIHSPAEGYGGRYP